MTMIGYNAKPAHNHLPIIDSIIAVKDRLPENMFYILPMTYGQIDDYMIKVKNKLDSAGLKYKIISDFMQFEDIAKLTKVTDVMIHLQTTDTLSATMMEHMYNGNIIVTGSWLPYQPIKKAGSYFLEIPSIDKIGGKLIEVINKIDECKQRCGKNKKAIRDFISWNGVLKSWIDIYEKKVIVPKFDHKLYWNNRYNYEYNLESSGYMGLGTIYNKYLYKSRLDILEYVIKTLFNNLDNKKVLELAPGTGYFTNYFAGFKLKEYLGIDISDVAVNNLRNKIKKFKFKIGNISDKKRSSKYKV